MLNATELILSLISEQTVYDQQNTILRATPRSLCFEKAERDANEKRECNHDIIM
jgi:hypothetical protein